MCWKHKKKSKSQNFCKAYFNWEIFCLHYCEILNEKLDSCVLWAILIMSWFYLIKIGLIIRKNIFPNNYGQFCNAYSLQGVINFFIWLDWTLSMWSWFQILCENFIEILDPDIVFIVLAKEKFESSSFRYFGVLSK